VAPPAQEREQHEGGVGEGVSRSTSEACVRELAVAFWSECAVRTWVIRWRIRVRESWWRAGAIYLLIGTLQGG
jgi:hypothetical protein